MRMRDVEGRLTRRGFFGWLAACGTIGLSPAFKGGVQRSMTYREESAELRRLVAEACRILGTEGQGDIVFGHVSARVDEKRYWMKGAGIGLEEVDESDVLLLDLEGNRLEGERARHIEYPIHSEIYRKRPDVRAVVHTHPFFSTILGATEMQLRPVTHEGSFFVPPPIPVFDRTSDLIATRELGEAVAETLGTHRVVFLRNHGIVVTGTTVEEACVGALLLEKAARAQLQAAGVGAFAWTSPEEALRKRERIYTPSTIRTIWEYYRRKSIKQKT